MFFEEKKGLGMEDIQMMELMFRTTKALERANEVIEKQERTFERIIEKTIEILAKEIKNG